jgi:hypothetical protein
MERLRPANGRGAGTRRALRDHETSADDIEAILSEQGARLARSDWTKPVVATKKGGLRYATLCRLRIQFGTGSSGVR